MLAHLYNIVFSRRVYLDRKVCHLLTILGQVNTLRRIGLREDNGITGATVSRGQAREATNSSFSRASNAEKSKCGEVVEILHCVDGKQRIIFGNYKFFLFSRKG
jgi:hypothetical protein